jgi:uncharacterized membrane protein HdeD (DUF308 family)
MLGTVTGLDDFLAPLSQGVWEVVVPKDSVTEPLDAGWKKSRINVPSPGTLASFRKARFHAHETKNEWRVHLDRYDPDVHPVLHLVDDAPLVLMISDTFMTLVMNTRRTDLKSTAAILRTQRFIWQEQVLSGLFLGLAGLFIIMNPLTVFRHFIGLVIPLAIICLAVILLVRAVRSGEPGKPRARKLRQGTGIFCAGIFAYILPLVLWVIAILAVLALWMFASAGMLLRRVMRGRSAVPEGFYSRLAIGVISLVLAVLLLFSPAGVLGLMISILGAVIVLVGVTLCINGLRLRSAMNGIPAS